MGGSNWLYLYNLPIMGWSLHMGLIKIFDSSAQIVIGSVAEGVRKCRPHKGDVHARGGGDMT